MEYNENRFVSFFTDKFRLSCATIYANKIMNDDPFFNRLTEINCKDLDNIIEEAENVFKSINVRPFIHCMDQNLKRRLEERNYILFDKISVLLLESAYIIKGVKGIAIKKISKDDLMQWINIYSIAFDAEDYKSELYNRLKDLNSLDLYIATIKGVITGCMALLPSTHLVGLYSLGVLPNYRRLGVASTLIRYAYDYAYSNNLDLFLHACLSKSMLNYYIKHGFVQLYIKEIYTKAS